MTLNFCKISNNIFAKIIYTKLFYIKAKNKKTEIIDKKGYINNLQMLNKITKKTCLCYTQTVQNKERRFKAHIHITGHGRFQPR